MYRPLVSSLATKRKNQLKNWAGQLSTTRDECLLVVQFFTEKTLMSHTDDPSLRFRVDTTQASVGTSIQQFPASLGTFRHLFPPPSLPVTDGRYCVAKGVQECHYSIRSFPGMSSSMITTVVSASGEVGELSLPAGLSFWATDEGASDDDAEKGEPRSTVSGVSGTAVGEATGLVDPLKR